MVLHVVKDNNNKIYAAMVCPQERKFERGFLWQYIRFLKMFCFFSSFSIKTKNLVFSHIMSMEMFVFTGASLIHTLNQNLSINYKNSILLLLFKYLEGIFYSVYIDSETPNTY